MKKGILLVIIFIGMGTGFLYFIIPTRMPISQRLTMRVNEKGFSRTILEEKKWRGWWPGEMNNNKGNEALYFRFNGYTYHIVEKRLSSIVVNITNEKDSLLTELFFIPATSDSIEISWESNRILPYMPIKRLQLYYATRQLKKDMKTILLTIKKFYANEENIYGIPIKKDHVTDSTLISTSASTSGYPTVETIYTLIENLKQYAQKNRAKQTGLPMLNINTSDSITFLTRVALPLDKKLKDGGKIVYRWMLGGGNILVTEIKGGPHAINKAFAEMENYINDNQRIAPAIPFQSLVTDRRKESDTSQWITRLYWPVM